MTVNGIDVASHQSSDYATSGLDFVFVKATEGHSYTNPKHAAQVATARAAGLLVGHYHFARAGSMSAQADYFLTHAQPRPGDVLAFDWEDTAVSGAEKDTWLRHVRAKAPEHRLVLYCNRDFWLHRDTTSYCADGLWIADPSAPKGEPRVQHPWLFHQYSSAGGLDRNVGNFPGRAALLRWAVGTTTTPQETGMSIWDTSLTVEKGAWSDKDYATSAERWLTLANIKAGRAQLAAEAALAQGRANGAGLTELKTQLAALTTPEIDYARLAAALLAAVATKGA